MSLTAQRRHGHGRRRWRGSFRLRRQHHRRRNRRHPLWLSRRLCLRCSVGRISANWNGRARRGWTSRRCRWRAVIVESGIRRRRASCLRWSHICSSTPLVVLAPCLLLRALGLDVLGSLLRCGAAQRWRSGSFASGSRLILFLFARSRCPLLELLLEHHRRGGCRYSATMHHNYRRPRSRRSCSQGT